MFRRSQVLRVSLAQHGKQRGGTSDQGGEKKNHVKISENCRYYSEDLSASLHRYKNNRRACLPPTRAPLPATYVAVDSPSRSPRRWCSIPEVPRRARICWQSNRARVCARVSGAPPKYYGEQNIFHKLVAEGFAVQEKLEKKRGGGFAASIFMGVYCWTNARTVRRMKPCKKQF